MFSGLLVYWFQKKFHPWMKLFNRLKSKIIAFQNTNFEIIKIFCYFVN